MDDIAHWRDLIMVYKKRLRALERQAAQLGSTCPPNIQLDIEEATQSITELENKMSAAIRAQDSTHDSFGELSNTSGVRLQANVGRSTTPMRIECPYPGMVPFRAEDARFFYGRDDEIRRMLQHLRYRNYLFIIGPSGSGKSSLLEAGLLPRLKESSFFPQGFWLVRSLRPGDQPTLALAQVFEGDLAQPNQTLADLLARYLPAQRLLLVVDQLEELFTQAEQAEQTRFIAALKSLRTLKNFALLITMRADFYSDLMNSDLWPVPPNMRLEIAPLRGEALRRAIRQPAQDVGVDLEANLLERLLADAANEPGVLPLIQETMILLWEQMDGRVLSLRGYEQLGDDSRSGLAAAISTKADAVIDELLPRQQVIARRVFLRLVQFGEGRADTPRQQSVATLRSASDEPHLFAFTLQHLTNNRLLTLSSEKEGTDRKVDLAHEVLITGWPTLQEWLAERREAEQTRRRLEAKAAEWARMGRGSGGLLDAAELPEAERWLDSSDASDLGFDETLPMFVGASRAAIVADEQEKEAIREQAQALEVMVSIGQSTFELVHRVGNDLGLVRIYVNNIRLELEKLAISDEFISKELDRIVVDVSRVLSLSVALKNELVNLREAQMQPHPKAVISVRDLLEKTAQSYPDLSPNVRVGIEIVEDVAHIYAVPSQVRDILRNLFANAIDAMPEGGDLILRAQNAGRYVEIQVADTGGGISQERQVRIFDLFYSTKGSFGFGLWSARRYVLANGGDLTVASQMGHGTIFTLLLLRADAEIGNTL